MGSIGDAYDNAMAKSFFSTLQRELLDQRRWEYSSPARIGRLRVDRGLVQPRRWHSSIGNLSPIDYEARFIPAAAAA
jgi:putative transposase